jgi:hypothetical protein
MEAQASRYSGTFWPLVQVPRTPLVCCSEMKTAAERAWLCLGFGHRCRDAAPFRASPNVRDSTQPFVLIGNSISLPEEIVLVLF